jgi:hypothetical protein
MANRPTPGRQAFKAELQKIEQHIPAAYSARVKEYLKKSGYAVKLREKLALLGRDNPDGMRIYINNVRKGHNVDWDVLAAFQQLVKEVKKGTLEPVEA